MAQDQTDSLRSVTHLFQRPDTKHTYIYSDYSWLSVLIAITLTLLDGFLIWP